MPTPNDIGEVAPPMKESVESEAKEKTIRAARGNQGENRDGNSPQCTLKNVIVLT